MYRQYFEYNTEIEDIVLGSLIIETPAFSRIKGIVESDFFYQTFNKDVFLVISEMFDNSIPIDLVTVTQKCYDKKLDKIHTNIAYRLSVSMNMIGSTNNLEYHCLIVREMHLKRLLIEIKNHINTDTDTLEETIKLEEALKKARQLKATNDWENFKDILMNIRLNLQTPHEDGIRIGIVEFDNIAGGLQPSEFIVIGARPSVGKTAFACQIALYIARQNKKVGIISLEMSNTKLSTRILSQISGLPYWKIDRRKIDDATELESINQSIESNYNLPIYFSEKTGVTVNDIRAKVMKAKHAHSLDIVFIDYLGLIEPEKANNREQEVSKISRGLKLLAMELKIPIVVLAQLNREVETNKHKPKLSNLRDSGSIEQDADMVMFIHSDFKAGILSDNAGNSTEDQRDLIVAKYRNGYTKDIKLGWNGERMQFSELDSFENKYVPIDKKTTSFDIF